MGKYVKYNSLVVGALIIIFWSILSFKVEMENLWFAPIDKVLYSIIDIFQNNHKDITSSFYLIAKASFLTIILGGLIGIVIGFYSNIYSMIDWFLDFWRSIPPIVVIFILINLESGTDYKWRVWLVIFGALPIMIMQIADAVINIPDKRFESLNTLNPSSYFLIKNIVLFEILPSLFSTTRTTISFAIVIVIVSEMIISPSYGIGESITSYQTAYQVSYVYGYAIILGLIGIFLNKILRVLENRIVKW